MHEFDPWFHYILKFYLMQLQNVNKDGMKQTERKEDSEEYRIIKLCKHYYSLVFKQKIDYNNHIVHCFHYINDKWIQ